MHKTQKRLVRLFSNQAISRSNLTLREIGRLIDVEHPQLVKHHLNQLVKKGLIKKNEDKKYKLVRPKLIEKIGDSELVTLPIYSPEGLAKRITTK